MPKYGVGNQDMTPGYEESLFQTSPENLVEHAKRYESQQGAKSFPGPGLSVTMRSALPELVIKGCPHCKGDIAKEDATWGYGDYSCNHCGRAWYVKGVTTEGLQLTPVSHISTEEPKRDKKRKERD